MRNVFMVAQKGKPKRARDVVSLFSCFKMVEFADAHALVVYMRIHFCPCRYQFLQVQTTSSHLEITMNFKLSFIVSPPHPTPNRFFNPTHQFHLHMLLLSLLFGLRNSKEIDAMDPLATVTIAVIVKEWNRMCWGVR